MAPPIFLLAILLSFLSLTTLTFAQTSTTPASTTSTVIPTIVPSASSYTYVGCYNETLNTNTTGGLRSLNGGVTEALDVMTIPLCMAFCKSNGYAYAGIEYTRECYCAQYLSALAPKSTMRNAISRVKETPARYVAARGHSWCICRMGVRRGVRAGGEGQARENRR
ncbi:wsc domain-containing protein [Botrytis cinerea]